MASQSTLSRPLAAGNVFFIQLKFRGQMCKNRDKPSYWLKFGFLELWKNLNSKKKKTYAIVEKLNNPPRKVKKGT